jgi:hypothetical protein
LTSIHIFGAAKVVLFFAYGTHFLRFDIKLIVKKQVVTAIVGTVLRKILMAFSQHFRFKHIVIAVVFGVSDR